MWRVHLVATLLEVVCRATDPPRSNKRRLLHPIYLFLRTSLIVAPLQRVSNDVRKLSECSIDYLKQSHVPALIDARQRLCSPSRVIHPAIVLGAARPTLASMALIAFTPFAFSLLHTPTTQSHRQPRNIPVSQALFESTPPGQSQSIGTEPFPSRLPKPETRTRCNHGQTHLPSPRLPRLRFPHRRHKRQNDPSRRRGSYAVRSQHLR